MIILVISIFAFVILCFLVNLYDKNKDKIMAKFNCEKKEIMECPHCFNTYDDLTLHFCKHCDTALYRKTKYIFPKKLKKKIIYSVIAIIVVIAVVIGGYLGISSFIKEQRRIEKYNNDLSICYETIKSEFNYDKFSSIIKEHTEETNFSLEAYEKLYQAVDEKIENLKKGNDDKDLITMLEDIKKKETSNKKIEERYLKATSYSSIIKINQYIEEQKYKEAYDLLETVIIDNKEKNQDIVDIATNKQNEIKDKALEQIIIQAQEKINAQDYSSAKTLLEKYKDLGNQTILDMYNNATNEVNRIETEKKAREEAERIAREKKEAEEKAKREAEEKARKKSQGVRIGMTKQDVLDSSWGKPDHINTTTTKYGVHEQWVYGGGNYLYFDDGILTSIQN